MPRRRPIAGQRARVPPRAGGAPAAEPDGAARARRLRPSGHRPARRAAAGGRGLEPRRGAAARPADGRGRLGHLAAPGPQHCSPDCSALLASWRWRAVVLALAYRARCGHGSGRIAPSGPATEAVAAAAEPRRRRSCRYDYRHLDRDFAAAPQRRTYRPFAERLPRPRPSRSWSDRPPRQYHAVVKAEVAAASVVERHCRPGRRAALRQPDDDLHPAGRPPASTSTGCG